MVIVFIAVLTLGLTHSYAAEPQSPAATQRPPSFKPNPANRQRFKPMIKRIAQRHRLDPALLYAVINVESAFDPNAVSSAGAMGLMQLMPATAKRFDVSDPFDPAANVNAGARYLRLLIKKFGTIHLALAAYHAGEGRVRRGRNTVPRILSTRKYVVRVIHNYMTFKKRGL